MHSANAGTGRLSREAPSAYIQTKSGWYLWGIGLTKTLGSIGLQQAADEAWFF